MLWEVFAAQVADPARRMLNCTPKSAFMPG